MQADKNSIGSYVNPTGSSLLLTSVSLSSPLPIHSHMVDSTEMCPRAPLGSLRLCHWLIQARSVFPMLPRFVALLLPIVLLIAMHSTTSRDEKSFQLKKFNYSRSARLDENVTMLIYLPRSLSRFFEELRLFLVDVRPPGMLLWRCGFERTNRSLILRILLFRRPSLLMLSMSVIGIIFYYDWSLLKAKVCK